RASYTDAVQVELIAGLSEERRGDVVARIVPGHFVRSVKRIQPQMRGEALRDAEGLGERRVQVEESRTGHAVIDRWIAARSVRRKSGERRRVEPAIGTRIRQGHAPTDHKTGECDEVTRTPGEQRADVPSTHNGVEGSRKAPQEVSAVAEGQFPVAAEGNAV